MNLWFYWTQRIHWAVRIYLNMLFFFFLRSFWLEWWPQWLGTVTIAGGCWSECGPKSVSCFEGSLPAPAATTTRAVFFSAALTDSSRPTSSWCRLWLRQCNWNPNAAARRSSDQLPSPFRKPGMCRCSQHARCPQGSEQGEAPRCWTVRRGHLSCDVSCHFKQSFVYEHYERNSFLFPKDFFF